VASALTAAGAAEVRITGGDRDRLEHLDLAMDDDPVPFAGPLAALITSIEQARHDPVVVLACDLPRVSAAAVTATVAALADADAAVPTDGDRPQWLHGAWRRRCLPALRARYRDGERAIHRAIADLDVHIVAGLDRAVLADADHPADLASTAYPATVDAVDMDITGPAADSGPPEQHDRGAGSA
jgi:molybdopterin-guanine dinucleotide biosynthesis protein A